MSDIIYGKNAVEEAFHSKIEIEKVYMLSNLRGEYEISIRQWCKQSNIPLAKVPEFKLNELAKNKIHQGIVALISPIQYTDYQNLIASIYDKGEIPLLTIVDGVTDVRNLGGIARSSYFFGAHGMIITNKISARINEDTVKTSAGAIMNLPVCRASSIYHVISDLQSAGIKVIASSLDATSPPDKCMMNVPSAILLGAEDKGLHYKVLEIVDEIVKIEGNTSFDSLNVSVAAGILLYECSRQRKVR